MKLHSRSIFVAPLLVLAGLLPGFAAAATPEPPPPVAAGDLVFEEIKGLVAFEAEHFFKQELTAVRAWHIVHAGNLPDFPGDHDDPPHVRGASGGAYIEILPDTRATHGHKLVAGENFANEPGSMAVLSYRVHFNTPGRYHVWCRGFSTGSEDNGTHFGLDDTWPASGQRWQTVKKHAWQWDSRQRTEQVHVGVPGQLFLEIPTAGVHTIHLSMREDGFEADKIVLARDPDYVPEGAGPPARVKSGTLPPAFPVPPTYSEPEPTRPAAPTPAASHPAASAPAAGAAPAVSPSIGHEMRAVDFPVDGTGFYLDRGRWLAINPDERKEAATRAIVPVGNARFDVTLFAVGENDGSSIYTVTIGGHVLPSFICPLSTHSFEEAPQFVHTWRNVEINEGEFLEVRAAVGSADGSEHSRARWRKVLLTPVGADPALLEGAIRAHTSAENVGPAATPRTPSAAAAPAPAAAAPARPPAPVESVLIQPRARDGDGTVRIGGELRQWHGVVVDLAGPFAHERDSGPNPFTDYRYTVVFSHESGARSYAVPGFFAADGDAANTLAEAGTVWRACFSPDRPGRWNYAVSFVRGPMAAIDPAVGTAVRPFDGASGTFVVGASNKAGRDFRAHGRLEYVGGHHLRFAGSGEHFLKAGPDAPETILAFVDFDNTTGGRPNAPLKTWAPHVRDWKQGDPTWAGGKGKGLIGALNHLANKGTNAFSFLTYNAGGDGDNVWPFVERDNKLHYDCSKLDQWGIVFSHAQKLGLYLHFKLQENETDDHRAGAKRTPKIIPEALDGGLLGPERKLYLREIIARFGHHLALNWNLGEENTQSYEEQRDMAAWIRLVDPYGHHTVIHTFPEQQDSVYARLIGPQSVLTGGSLQNSWSAAHQRTLQWVRASAAAGRPWVIANDEQGPAGLGVPPDPGYEGFSGTTEPGNEGRGYDLHDIRKLTLWGNLMAGGAGVEYYFGYRLPQNDLVCEDFRSRDRSWDYCRIALDFFRQEKIPFWRMRCDDALVGNPHSDNSRYCLAEPGALYLVYLPTGGTAELDLTSASGPFQVTWFNPRAGGRLQPGSIRRVQGGTKVALGTPPSDPAEDWLVIVRR